MSAADAYFLLMTSDTPRQRHAVYHLNNNKYKSINTPNSAECRAEDCSWEVSLKICPDLQTMSI